MENCVAFQLKNCMEFQLPEACIYIYLLPLTWSDPTQQDPPATRSGVDERWTRYRDRRNEEIPSPSTEEAAGD